jgi:Secretion system C-terminal sorting domain
VFECGGGGINAIESDYITIENNKVYNNAWYSLFANSGINIFHAWNFDGNTSSYRNVIRNNISYGNEMLVPWPSAGCTFTDGNGIIIDDCRNTQSGSGIQGQLYGGKTLIENNIVYTNGGRAIHIYQSDSVTVLNNTTYKNCKTASINDGEITVITGTNNKVYNNIMYANDGKKGSTQSGFTNYSQDFNVLYNSTTWGLFGVNDIVANPNFTNAATGDFTLLNNSPAINSGNYITGNYSINDITNITRPVGPYPEIGAHEFIAVPANTTNLTPNNLAVLKITNGGTPIGNTGLGYSSQIVEFNTAGSPTGTNILLTGGTPNFVVEERTIAHEGQLNLSADKKFLTAVGYNSAIVTAAATMRAGEKRIARINAAGTVDLTTYIPTAEGFGGVSMRSAVTLNGSSYFAQSGTTGTPHGVRKVDRVINHTTSTQATTAGAFRSLGYFNNIMYATIGASAVVSSYDATGTTATALTFSSAIAGAEYTQMVFLDVDAGIPGVDLLYIADRNGGIRKFYLSGTTWMTTTGAQGFSTGANAGYFAMTGRIENGKPTLYALKIIPSGNSYLVKAIDEVSRTTDWGVTGNFPIFGVLASTNNTEQFKGVAFTPNSSLNVSAPLPITLASFSGTLLNNKAILEWTSTTEINSKEFIVEKSSDGITFNKITLVPARNISSGSNYNYCDESIITGINYYRLKLVDNDGSFKHSNIILLKADEVKNNRLTVFPNPVVNNITITYPTAYKNSIFTIYNNLGVKLYSYKVPLGSNQRTIDVGRLPKGIFYINYNTNSKSIISSFVKMTD